MFWVCETDSLGLRLWKKKPYLGSFMGFLIYLVSMKLNGVFGSVIVGFIRDICNFGLYFVS